MADDEPIVEKIEDPDPYDRALALAKEYISEPNPKRLSICVRCGVPIANRGSRPWPDENDVPWLKCPKGCQPPEGAEGSCVPMDYRRYTSIFDPTKLNPDDALYEEPDDPADDGSDDDSGDIEDDDKPAEPTHSTIEEFLLRRAQRPLRDDLPGGRG